MHGFDKVPVKVEKFALSVRPGVTAVVHFTMLSSQHAGVAMSEHRLLRLELLSQRVSSSGIMLHAFSAAVYITEIIGEPSSSFFGVHKQDSDIWGLF